MLHVSMTGQVTITGLLYRFGGNLRSLLQQLVVGMYLAICCQRLDESSAEGQIRSRPVLHSLMSFFNSCMLHPQAPNKHNSKSLKLST